MLRRRLLMFVLCLALPLQGYAAASMLWCGPGLASKVVQAQGEHQGHAAHRHSAGVSSGEAHALQHVGAHADEHGAQPDTGSAKCSLCAVCSVGMALLPTVPVIGVSPMPESIAPQPLRLLAAFLTGGVERPPRTVLA